MFNTRKNNHLGFKNTMLKVENWICTIKYGSSQISNFHKIGLKSQQKTNIKQELFLTFCAFVHCAICIVWASFSPFNSFSSYRCHQTIWEGQVLVKNTVSDWNWTHDILVLSWPLTTWSTRQPTANDIFERDPKFWSNRNETFHWFRICFNRS